MPGQFFASWLLPPSPRGLTSAHCMQLAIAAALAGLAQRAGRLAASFALALRQLRACTALHAWQAGLQGLTSREAPIHPSTVSSVQLPFKRTLLCSLLHLQATRKGLTSEEAAKRLAEYGPNKLPEETRNAFLVYLGVSEICCAALRCAACCGRLPVLHADISWLRDRRPSSAWCMRIQRCWALGALCSTPCRPPWCSQIEPAVLGWIEPCS